MEATEIKHFVEAALLAAGRPLNIDQLKGLFDQRMAPEKGEIRKAIATLNEEYEDRGIVITEVASGFRMQVKAAMADRLQKLWEERPPRYSRALFETLALVAYRQPITRGDIEDIRGVTVSSNIVRQLLERDWIRVVGHRDVPGRPAMFGTTRSFLDYFGLKKLDDLPPLADLSDWESLRVQLNLPEVEEQTNAGSDIEAMAAEHDLPVLYAEAEEDEGEFPDEEDVAEAVARAQAIENIPELNPETDAAGIEEEAAATREDELVVNKWPDPLG
ncbi:MAG: SMC-Scp complex subunit ScpB [Woeseiaceae bacterium]|nr:SMC-Scp complex subunit ScpB [Woeseiaceae bacterium]